MSLNPKITVNRRHQRTQQILALIMPIIAKYTGPDLSRVCYNELVDVINNEGMEIITANMRKEAGLESRNENGCTPLELMLIEYYFMSRMLKPIIVQFPPPISFELIKDDDKCK